MIFTNTPQKIKDEFASTSRSLLERLSSSTSGLSLNVLERMLATFAGAFTQNNRLFKLRIGDGALFGDLLLPQKVEGTERLSASYKYDVVCYSPDAFIPLESLLGQSAQLDIITGSAGLFGLASEDVTRCGLITAADALPSDGGFAKYLLTIESPLALLHHRHASRIFQDKTVPEIVEQILTEHIRANRAIGGILKLRFNLLRTDRYKPRSYCVQYRESDLAFIERLLFEEGLPYTFHHEAGEAPSVTFTVFDDPYSLPQASQGSVRFHRANATEKEDSITQWTESRRIGPVAASLISYDYKPVVTHGVVEDTRTDQGKEGRAAESTLEDYDAQTNYYAKDNNDLGRYATRRQEAHDLLKGWYRAEGNCRQLKAGEWFSLTGHPYFDRFVEPEYREFVACEVRFEAHNNLPGDMLQYLDSQKQGESPPKPYWVLVETRRRGLPLTPAYGHTLHARPTALGPQSATVVGPHGEEVYTDSMGRIKIQLHWQREKEHPDYGSDWDERSSCWVRVSYPSAGDAWGHQSIPRIHQEVLVDFLEGDIDRPVVTGVIHNGRQSNPWFSDAGRLPANRTLTGIKTKEHHGQQYGELLFDDTTGQVRTKLSSEHGKTQLNQGFLTHPRNEGEAEPRGEGFELRTDRSGAIRAAKGVLISAHGRTLAAGSQLDREELVAQLELALEIAKALAEDSEANEAETTNTDPQKRLTEYVKTWEDGSNTVKGGKQLEGKSIAALTAPEGVAVSSESNIIVTSGASQDFVSMQDANHTVGQRLRMRVGDAFSLFARQTMKIIAALGKIRIAALSNEIEVAAKKKLHLISLEEIVLDAPKITLRASGAGVEYGGGITSKTKGAHVRYAGSHSMKGPANVKPEGSLKTTEVRYDQRIQLTWEGSGEPVKNRQYRLHLEDGRKLNGTTDDEGYTEEVESDVSFARYRVEILPSND